MHDCRSFRSCCELAGRFATFVVVSAVLFVFSCLACFFSCLRRFTVFPLLLPCFRASGFALPCLLVSPALPCRLSVAFVDGLAGVSASWSHLAPFAAVRHFFSYLL